MIFPVMPTYKRVDSKFFIGSRKNYLPRNSIPTKKRFAIDLTRKSIILCARDFFEMRKGLEVSETTKVTKVFPKIWLNSYLKKD